MDPLRLRFRPPFFSGCLLLLPLLLNGLVVFQTYAVDLEVKDDANLSCLFAKWMVKFSISYEGTDESKTSTFMLPEDLSYIGTSCGNETSGPVLSIEFGDGNSWSISFTKTKDTYQGAITFVYNTGDLMFFPDAKRKERITVVANFPANPVPLNTAFSCDTEDTVKSGDVTQTFQSVTLQAFLQDGRLSSQKTLCDNDTTTSTVAAATRSIALAANTSTSESNATETLSSPTIQPEEKPASGSYTVKSGPVTCILANMGLQLNVTQQVPMITNFNPNNTVASGNCGKTTAVLRLSDGNTKIDFLFAVKNSTSSEKFYLKGVDITTADSPNATFSASNHTLNNWETTMGNSYLCRKEESILVSPGYKINIFDLKIQPFEVEEGQFSAGSFNRRKRNSLYVTVSLLIVSLLILTVGLAATTRTQNVTVGGYYPGAILGFGSFLGIIGSNLIENKRQMLVASIVFISFGVIAAFCCAIVDGVFAARHIDLRPLYAGRCHYYAKSTTQPKTVCHPQPRSSCVPKIRTNTCFCCDLYHCGRMEISGGYYEFIDVNSCQDIVHLYHLLWSATVLNILGLVLGIITAAILGGFKDMIPAHPTLTCTVENTRPTVSYYSRPHVTSYNTYHSTPHLPPYSAYDFQHSSLFATSSPSGLPEDPLSLPPSPSLVWSPTGAPPRYSPPYFPPSEKPPPYSP